MVWKIFQLECIVRSAWIRFRRIVAWEPPVSGAAPKRTLPSYVQNEPMPVLVDREKTRSQIAEIAADIVANEGLGALTMRRLATAAGTSKILVSTYFGSMAELVLATFAIVADRMASDFTLAQEQGRGLEGCVAALMPLDADTYRGWRVLVAFHGVAVTDPVMYAQERTRMDGAIERMAVILAQEYGYPRVTARVKSEARLLLNIMRGASYDIIFSPYRDRRPSERRKIIQIVTRGIDL